MLRSPSALHDKKQDQPQQYKNTLQDKKTDSMLQNTKQDDVTKISIVTFGLLLLHIYFASVANVRKVPPVHFSQVDNANSAKESAHPE